MTHGSTFVSIKKKFTYMSHDEKMSEFERGVEVIELTGVSKFYGSSRILNELSFSIPDGQTYALLGLSGSGKTTALKLICGLQQADSGEVRVQNTSVCKENLHGVRAQLGYVIQDGGLFPHLTAFENLSIVGREAGWGVEKIKTRVEELAALTKIATPLLDKFPIQLSGGQRQRVGLMRALMRDPPILLLDEPLGALDPITRSELQTELRDLCRRFKKTVLLVTHDLFEAGFLADKILLLNQGHILQQGTLKELINHPADDFVRRFVDSHKHQVEA